MSDPLIPDFCDMCGCNLKLHALDYKVKIEVLSGDMRRDIGLDSPDPAGEINKLIEDTAAMTEAELMDGVYRRMEFRICPPCQKKYIAEPIPRKFK